MGNHGANQQSKTCIKPAHHAKQPHAQTTRMMYTTSMRSNKQKSQNRGWQFYNSGNSARNTHKTCPPPNQNLHQTSMSREATTCSNNPPESHVSHQCASITIHVKIISNNNITRNTLRCHVRAVRPAQFVLTLHD